MTLEEILKALKVGSASDVTIRRVRSNGRATTPELARELMNSSVTFEALTKAKSIAISREEMAILLEAGAKQSPE